MDTTVFYAWQDDRAKEQHHYFLRDVLRDAIRDISADSKVEESPRLDHDTQGKSGTPDISTTIFEKIQNCVVFVADVTFVGRSVLRKKYLPNPNVLIELGYAARSIGWERIVLVMNEAYGSWQKLPFDLQNRRKPVLYKWPRAEVELTREKINGLRQWLKLALAAALQEEHASVNNAVGSLDESCLKIMRASNGNSFSGPVTDKPTLFANLEITALNQTIRTLINLKLLVCDVNSNSNVNKHAYHWSALGKLVLRKLEIGAVVPQVDRHHALQTIQINC